MSTVGNMMSTMSGVQYCRGTQIIKDYTPPPPHGTEHPHGTEPPPPLYGTEHTLYRVNQYDFLFPKCFFSYKNKQHIR